jgi:dynein heavy chain
MYGGKTLDTIKAVSDMASKQNFVKIALDTLEKEIREIGFECELYKNTEISIIKEPELVSQKYEEFLAKTQSLKGNPFAQHLIDRVLKNEKAINTVLGNFEKWEKVQKSWLYLEPIYTQKDVIETLKDQSIVFNDLN